MHLARVVGTVVSTHKDARLSGVKLLVIQPVGRDGTDTGRALGNHPQAYSHMGLIENALNLDLA